MDADGERDNKDREHMAARKRMAFGVLQKERTDVQCLIRTRCVDAVADEGEQDKADTRNQHRGEQTGDVGQHYESQIEEIGGVDNPGGQNICGAQNADGFRMAAQSCGQVFVLFCGQTGPSSSVFSHSIIVSARGKYKRLRGGINKSTTSAVFVKVLRKMDKS